VLPHGCEYLVRILRIHDHVGGSCLLVDVEYPSPGGASVLGLEHTPLRILPPERTGGGYIGDILVGGVEHDPGYVLSSFQPEVRPRPPPVQGSVDAVADTAAVADVVLAGTDPDDIGIILVDSHRPETGDGLVVEDRFPCMAAVYRFPQSTGGGTHVDYVRI